MKELSIERMEQLKGGEASCVQFITGLVFTAIPATSLAGLAIAGTGLTSCADWLEENYGCLIWCG